MSYAVLFPGQGSQTVGMGADVFAARPDLLGESADVLLGWSLSQVCAEGPEEELTRTERAQPALYAVAYALWDAFRVAAPQPAAAAGHSLGEYTALAAAGVLSFEDGLRLVAARGAAMAQAAESVDSGMAALLGGDAQSAEALAAARREAGGALWVANLNAPGQVVVAGGANDIAWAQENVRDFGIRRAIPLKVAGAFHSPLMEPAAAALVAALAAAPVAEPVFPVWANADAAPADDIVDALRRQLTSPVRFADSLEAMAAGGIDTFVHIGPGDVTANLAKRTVPEATIHTVNSLDAVPDVVEAIQ
jgi:[acyl-carrier-protein] S-malonyltransferase